MDNIKLSIKTDSDGATNFTCPTCNKEFKLYARDTQGYSTESLFCTYCGLSNIPQAFMPKDIIDEAKNRVRNQMQQEISKIFSGIKSSKYVKFKHNTPAPIEEKQLTTKDTVDTHWTCLYCKKEFKTVNTVEEKVYCAYCGEML